METISKTEILENADVPKTIIMWGDFHACSPFARSTVPEEKWGTTRSLILTICFQIIPINAVGQWSILYSIFHWIGALDTFNFFKLTENVPKSSN